jgi:DNA-binding NarL/FixJ family response regulator
MQTKNADAMVENFARAQNLLEDIDARRTLSKLLKMASTFGVEEELPKLRRGPYKAARNNPMGLTRREQQILALMVKGAQNRDIAQSLSRSPRTIEHHVSSILTKLNANSRMEAMLRVQHEPWLLPEDETA